MDSIPSQNATMVKWFQKSLKSGDATESDAVQEEISRGHSRIMKEQLANAIHIVSQTSRSLRELFGDEVERPLKLISCDSAVGQLSAAKVNRRTAEPPNIRPYPSVGNRRSGYQPSNRHFCWTKSVMRRMIGRRITDRICDQQ